MSKECLGQEGAVCSAFRSLLQDVLSVVSCVSQMLFCRLGSALGLEDLLRPVPLLVFSLVRDFLLSLGFANYQKGFITITKSRGFWPRR